MPPAPLISSMAISAECLAEAPSAAANPVSGAKKPILMGPCAPAGATARTSATADRTISTMHRFMVGSPPWLLSIAETLTNVVVGAARRSLSSKLWRPNRRRSTGRVGRVGPWETRSDCLAHRPPVGCRYACHDVRRRVSQGPPPPALSAVLTVGSTTRGARLSCATLKRLRAPNLPTTGLSSAVIVGQFHERPSTHDSAARAPRGGRERRVGLRKPVVVRRARRTAYRHSGGRLDGPIGFPKAHPSLPPGERAVRVRTETLPAPYLIS